MIKIGQNNNTFYISSIFKGNNADNAEIPTRDLIKSIEGFEESVKIISKNIYGKECSIGANVKAPKQYSIKH